MSTIRALEDQKLIESINRNGISIELLREENKEELLKLVINNKDNSGYHAMDNDIFNGEKFSAILSGKEDSRCIIARQKSTDKIIGFVVFAFSYLLKDEKEEDKTIKNIGVISEIGVDSEFSFSKKSDVKNVGTSLLYVACHEMILTNPDLISINTLASNTEAGKFYEANHFNKLDTDDEDWSLSKEDFLKLKERFISRSNSKLEREEKKSIATHARPFPEGHRFFHTHHPSSEGKSAEIKPDPLKRRNSI